MRPAFDALLDIDEALGAVAAAASQPALAAIKLAWWRERLQELDQARIPAEPRLEAAARELLPRGISGTQLSELEAGWAALLRQEPDADQVLERGARLFAMGAGLLENPAPGFLSIAVRIYVSGTLSRSGSAVAITAPIAQSPRIPSRFRPLTALAALAKRDLQRAPIVEPEATPGRAWTILRHRLTGRL